MGDENGKEFKTRIFALLAASVSALVVAGIWIGSMEAKLGTTAGSVQEMDDRQKALLRDMQSTRENINERLSHMQERNAQLQTQIARMEGKLDILLQEKRNN